MTCLEPSGKGGIVASVLSFKTMVISIVNGALARFTTAANALLSLLLLTPLLPC